LEGKVDSVLKDAELIALLDALLLALVVGVNDGPEGIVAPFASHIYVA
jgi:hypothetical protein